MYQALYRKYRPLLFRDVVGQESVVKVLKNSIINNHVGHAYLFYGSRGTGKTSLAKIFARTINCIDLQEGEICQKCENCVEMLESDSVDIIEIDAASNNGVDEIRELKNKINLVPNKLKYKVYIIDEVHMLSIGAFNALLKTLEEPPEHIVFILATTDPHKVPETIKSRCQCFNFKRISNADIVNRLEKICDIEKISVEKKVLEYVANSSGGGLRDSLSMLDMLYSSCGNYITIKDYIEMNDLVEKEELLQLLDEILSANIDLFLTHIEKIYSCGKNLIQICELLLQEGRNIIVQSYQGEFVNFDLHSLEQLVFLLNEKIFDIKKASNPKIYIEIMILKFINTMLNIHENRKNISREIIVEQKFDNKVVESEEKSKNYSELDDDVNSVEIESIKKEDFDNEGSYDRIESDFLNKYRDIIQIRVNNTLCKADKNLLINVKEQFKKLNEFVFDQKIGYLVCALMDGTIRVASDENIIISIEYDSMIDENIKNIEKLQNTLQQVTGLKQKLAFITNETWNQKKQEYIQKLQNGENYQYLQEPELPVIIKQVKKDELVNHAIELFGDIVEEE